MTDTLEQIAAEVRVCTACDLHLNRIQAVPGAGNPNADILFIGEGPGFNEDKQGLPFVGRSGQYLEKLLALIDLTRADVFITNVVKNRPPDNRDPLPAEIAACAVYLDRQIAVIDPLVIVTLGRFSMARYFPNSKITQIHGKAKIENGRGYIPLFHPAAVLRNPTLEPQMQADVRSIPLVLEQVRAARTGENNPNAPTTTTQQDDDAPPIQLTLF